jgi:hypothetical protein
MALLKQGRRAEVEEALRAVDQAINRQGAA